MEDSEYPCPFCENKIPYLIKYGAIDKKGRHVLIPGNVTGIYKWPQDCVPPLPKLSTVTFYDKRKTYHLKFLDDEQDKVKEFENLQNYEGKIVIEGCLHKHQSENTKLLLFNVNICQLEE